MGDAREERVKEELSCSQPFDDAHGTRGRSHYRRGRKSCRKAIAVQVSTRII